MVPKRCKVKAIQQETRDTYTLVLQVLEENPFSWLPGQFNMLYLFGFGEVPISISGSKDGDVEHTIRAVGPLTDAMGELKEGDEMGLRGPFGTAWPVEKKGGNLLAIAGGLGLAPLRPALREFAKRRGEFTDVTLLYGAREPADLLYANEIEEWKKKGVNVQISVDKPNASWHGHVGVVTSLIGKALKGPLQTRVFLCGPEIMMKFALVELLRNQVREADIFLSMERNMKCATGFCGHCQFGPYFLCKDGPIFTHKQVKPWMAIQEL